MVYVTHKIVSALVVRNILTNIHEVIVFSSFGSLGEVVARRVSRKYSLGSSLDLVGTQCWPSVQHISH